MTQPPPNELLIAFVGNIANNFFREARAIRSASSIHVDLYFFSGPATHDSYRPESDLPHLRDNYPQWIIHAPFPLLREFVFLSLGLLTWCRPPVRNLVERLNSYDVVFLSGLEVLLAPSIKATTIFRVTGGDFTIKPFYLRHLHLIGLTSGWKRLFRPQTFLNSLLESILQRRAISRSDFVSFRQSAGPYQDAQRKLGIPTSRVVSGRRLVVDSELYSPSLKTHDAVHSDFFTIFLPSRAQMSTSKIMRITGQYKGTEVAIRGIAAFLASLPHSDRRRVRVRVPATEMSDQLDDLRALVADLNLLESFDFLEGTSSSHLTRSEMISEYRRATVTLDDFGAGWYGSIVVEALSCGSPVITWVSPAILAEFDWHPLLVAQDADMISAHLAFLFRASEREMAQVKSRGRDWIKQYHSAASGTTELVALLSEICSRREKSAQRPTTYL